MSSHYLNYIKNPRERVVLGQIRSDYKRLTSRCAYCKKQSTEINVDQHRVIFVCDDHFEEGVDKIIPNDMPGVHHVIYPNGLKLSKEALDPNIGGLAPRGPVIK